MITTLAISGYRSLREVVLPLGRLNLITGANGSGKSSLYRALRLIAETAQGGIIGSLAREGGLASTLWAGPFEISRRMLRGEVRVQGTARSEPTALKLGFATADFGYAIDLGVPGADKERPMGTGPSKFKGDPVIKREVIWGGPVLRNSNVLVDRRSATARVRDNDEWKVANVALNEFESIFTELIDPRTSPEVLSLRETIRGWRFYDQLRVDGDAPARQPQVGTRTPVLAADGRDLAAAWQTILETGNGPLLEEALADAFPSSSVNVETNGTLFNLELRQHGLLRPLTTAELSDGTLRYLLWVAALHTPRPPPLMVLNEPETSLHIDLLPALGRLIIEASKRSQVWVISHAPVLIETLREAPDCTTIALEKQLGETIIAGQHTLERPPWYWPKR